MKTRQFIAMLLCMVFLVYAMSIGPAIRWHYQTRFYLSRSMMLETPYAPLFVLSDYVPGWDAVLWWYMDMWRPRS